MIITHLTVAADHPAYAGHFPGAPVLPAVVLLGAVIQALERSRMYSRQPWRIESAKFQSAVQPGEPLVLEHDALPNGSIRFAIRCGERAIASGVLSGVEPTG